MSVAKLNPREVGRTRHIGSEKGWLGKTNAETLYGPRDLRSRRFAVRSHRLPAKSFTFINGHIFSYVVSRSSGSTRVSATEVMKFTSPVQRGSTCMWMWFAMPWPRCRTLRQNCSTSPRSPRRRCLNDPNNYEDLWGLFRAMRSLGAAACSKSTSPLNGGARSNAFGVFGE